MILRVIWQYIDRLIAPKSYMDRSAAEVHITFWGNQPVHILPFDPKYHELFVILCFSQVYFQGINCGWSNLVVHVHAMLSILLYCGPCSQFLVESRLPIYFLFFICFLLVLFSCLLCLSQFSLLHLCPLTFEIHSNHGFPWYHFAQKCTWFIVYM